MDDKQNIKSVAVKDEFNEGTTSPTQEDDISGMEFEEPDSPDFPKSKPPPKYSQSQVSPKKSILKSPFKKMEDLTDDVEVVEMSVDEDSDRIDKIVK